MKKKSLLLIAIITVLLVLTSCEDITGGIFGNNNNKEENVTVFSGGTTEYSIVTSADASDDEKDLAKALFDVSAASPEILTDDSSECALEIVIGDTNRAVTAELVKKIQDAATTMAFHYLVAESNGKIVILSNADVGYVYALEYIKETYINGGAFVIPKGTCDLNRVIWDDYYASDLYYDRLLAEQNKPKPDDKPDDGGEDGGDDGIFTLEEMIEYYKNLVASFNTADFGTYSATEFTSKDTYRAPTVYPTAGAHPRVLFTENSIDSVRENLTATQNYHANTKYIALSNAGCDGKFKPVTGNMTDNWDASIASKIEAMAFRYAMTGEKLYGYQAIYALKNAILTINVPHTVGDWCRTYGYLMYVAGCVYDWCYDLLTDTDKTQLINGTVNLLGMHLEIVCYIGPLNKAPIAQGVLYDHGAEDQLLVDYLSFAIACYDEAPEIYELVAGRILNDYVEGQNYLNKSDSHSQGSMYGFVRSAATLVSNILFNKMTDGAVTPFENMDDVIKTGTYYLRPDGQMYRIGDINENKTLSTFQFVWFANDCFYAGNLYKDEYLKSYAYEYLDGFKSFSSMVCGLSAVQFLAVNDTSVSHVFEGTAPLTRTTSWPHTSIFAKSANDDENAFGIYMTMPEHFTASHAHMECGSFQIFYKGALASDSGAYSGWGDAHHMGYTMQTIASNSLIIYNPSLLNTFNAYRPTMIYSGGQTLQKSGQLPKTLAELLAHDRLNQCTSLGVVNKEENGKYLYSYMGGDMTAAYDSETVDEVTRYMLAVATGDPSCPLVFLTFDRITSDSADYHKAALIHVQQEPTITKDGFAIVTNGGGKMVVQSVGDATEYVKWGGEGKEFWIPGVKDGKYSLEAGKNLPSGRTLIDGSIAEYGWGRIEISPAVPEKTNHMLTVMYVTDASNNATVKAEDISSENLAGTMIFGKAMLFSKNEKLLTEESTFTINSGADCFVAGVSAGTWNVTCGTETQTVTVEDGENLLTFTAGAAGTYTIAPVK